MRKTMVKAIATEGLALLTLVGMNAMAQDSRVNNKTTYHVEVGDVRVVAIGRSAKARTNIGGVDGTPGNSGNGSVRCGTIQRIVIGEDASVTVTLPNDAVGECQEE